jgi:UDP-N-acetylglucosamine--N-acetylmuramyl-(pentapeptide) pyrophosphoryl-undecaprenol N-acetylglucosamine transferase
MGVAAGKPLVLHDAKCRGGLATRVLAHGADRILLGFPQALKGRHAKRVEWVGNPLRDSVCTLPPPGVRFCRPQRADAPAGRGGSLGAKGLNDLVPAALAQLPLPDRPLVVHQAGATTHRRTA